MRSNDPTCLRCIQSAGSSQLAITRRISGPRLQPEEDLVQPPAQPFINIPCPQIY
ncbi:hypothetical protein B0H34DRAFT_681183, partial [Crassisporium funariophilum]